ncbi:hypothetical protein C900_05731 [Fulvivirga imtechensis AK7]|uniref:YopX protein domain-containing protein n=1 Tax=Fulvivirga imtechensis AK7 TaxID=1237149 RepID=L8JVL4_9BACT|nr:YopX family protein [Fulvivirga imtechensis]ELR73096.1 hypothetical protein C900_05731 [Fulvivirga imtechensis AK7]
MKSRIFKFKAWNTEAKLIVRLNQIDCIKGELHKKGHILLQYSGVNDKSGSELYENDIVLIDSKRSIIHWDEARSAWCRIEEGTPDVKIPLLHKEMEDTIRLCNYYESPDSFKARF